MEDTNLLLLLDGLEREYQRRYDSAMNEVRSIPYMEGYYEGKVDLIHEIRENLIKNHLCRNEENKVCESS
jgi:hypothetical protein